MDTRAQLSSDAFRALVARSTLAPSTHNTQPWRWVLRAGHAELELSRDVGRLLPVNDPSGREAVISCGAALLSLRVAAAHALMNTRVQTLPDPRRPELLAVVELVDGSVDAAFSVLDAAAPIRHTWRYPFTSQPVSAHLVWRLEEEALAEHATLHVVTDDERPALARLVHEADVARFADPERREELAQLVQPWWTHEGAPASLPALLPRRAAIRHLDLGRRVGAADSALLMDAPLVVVLSTASEDAPSWLAAGQALQRILLVAAAGGVLAGFANQPCQDPGRRPAVRDLFGEGHPQIIMRLGYPVAVPRATQRRRVSSVLEVEDGAQDGAQDGAEVVDEEFTEDELG